MNTVDEVLQNCTIDGKVVFLPDVQLDRKLYLQVQQKLEFIGGQWSRKERGFIFEHFPDELLKNIQEGQQINLKKDFQFFETPSNLAKMMVALCDFDFSKGTIIKVLEPSAGKGTLLKELPLVSGFFDLTVCEINALCFPFLKDFPGINIIEGDFLKTYFPANHFDIIIANPPFSKNQDIDHIEKMYELCRPGGKIVSVASVHWQISTFQKETRFRNWLDSIDSEIIPIDKGMFKESGTMVPSSLIVINK